MDPEITKKPMSPKPVYSNLQELNKCAGSPNTIEPVYNDLEAPDHSDAGKTDKYGPSDLQNPVYNVPLCPKSDKSSVGGLDSNASERQDPGSYNNSQWAAKRYITVSFFFAMHRIALRSKHT